jgi:hypothetical protein
VGLREAKPSRAPVLAREGQDAPLTLLFSLPVARAKLQPVKVRNALGYVIGGDDGDARLVLGRNVAGELIGIEEVGSGLACTLTCPECVAPLVAKKGPVRAHHFAHAPGSDCFDETGALETQAHRLAKTVLAGSHLLLPSLEYLGETGPQVDVREVEIEPMRGAVRPDLICQVAWRPDDSADARLIELAVEIKVTHPFNLVKAGLFAEQRLRCIEIDLSRYRYKEDAEIAAAVRSSAPRRWVWKKAPMPINRPELPNGPVPRRGSFKQPAPPEIDVEGWAEFNRRHPAPPRPARSSPPPDQR